MSPALMYRAVFSALALALTAACAGGGTTSAESASPARTQTAQQQAAPTTSGYTEAQLRSYAAAKAEIAPIMASFASMTPEQRTAATAQIRAVQQRHGLDAVTYDAIASRASTDQELSRRIAGLELGTITDAQIQAFAAASVEIEPLNQSLATAVEPRRTEIAGQIRAALTQHGLDGATYNAITSRAQADPALAQRIATAQAAARTSDSGE